MCKIGWIEGLRLGLTNCPSMHTQIQMTPNI